MPLPDFVPFPKLSRFCRYAVVTEKLDGTNAQVHITADGQVIAGSRNRWITTDDDNYGFARWVERHSAELLALGPGSHFGEWWGCGIQRNYDSECRTFSLFNTERWGYSSGRPQCCSVVPVLWRGDLDKMNLVDILDGLRKRGSVASSGFMSPEGIVIWHSVSNRMFKVTLDNDAVPKSVVTNGQ